MVAQQTSQATQQLYRSFDDMSVFDRTQITRQIDSAKNTKGLALDWDWNDDWKSRITTEFNDKIKADIQLYKSNREAERQIQRNNQRQQGNIRWDNKQNWGKDNQPTDWSGRTIGFKAYKWLRNFKATNGNWYAEYQPVRGGENRKFFDLAMDEEAKDTYVMSLQCQACNKTFRGMAPLDGNVCPDCGAQSDRLRYRGRYSL